MTTPTDAELSARLAEISAYLFPVYLDRGDNNVIKQAADRLTALSAEVERLKDWEAFAATELQTAKMAAEQRTQQLMAAKKEVERLREALKVYADEKNWHCTEFGEYHEHGEKCCKDGWWTRSEHGYDVAREAIKENQSENRVCE